MLNYATLYYATLCYVQKKDATLQSRIEKNISVRIASLGNLSAHHTTFQNDSPNNLQILLYFSKREIVQNKAFDLSHHFFDLRHFAPSNVHSIHPSKDNSLDAKSGSKNAPIKPRTRVIQYIGEIHSCIPLDNVQFHQNLLYYSDISGNILPI